MEQIQHPADTNCYHLENGSSALLWPKIFHFYILACHHLNSTQRSLYTSASGVVFIPGIKLCLCMMDILFLFEEGATEHFVFIVFCMI